MRCRRIPGLVTFADFSLHFGVSFVLKLALEDEHLWVRCQGSLVFVTRSSLGQCKHCCVLLVDLTLCLEVVSLWLLIADLFKAWSFIYLLQVRVYDIWRLLARVRLSWSLRDDASMDIPGPVHLKRGRAFFDWCLSCKETIDYATLLVVAGTLLGVRVSWRTLRWYRNDLLSMRRVLRWSTLLIDLSV